jgi:hypothetical protein
MRNGSIIEMVIETDSLATPGLYSPIFTDQYQITTVSESE